MSETGWTSDELARIGDAEELTIQPCRAGKSVPIWVAADDAVNDAVDAACRDKYARYPSYVEPMVTARARATTRRLVPVEALA